jgi:hypothetical protein
MTPYLPGRGGFHVCAKNHMPLLRSLALAAWFSIYMALLTELFSSSSSPFSLWEDPRKARTGALRCSIPRTWQYLRAGGTLRVTVHDRPHCPPILFVFQRRGGGLV